jgi:hypothetical protein
MNGCLHGATGSFRETSILQEKMKNRQSRLTKATVQKFNLTEPFKAKLPEPPNFARNRLMILGSLSDNPRSGLAEVLAERFLLPRSRVAGLLFQLVGLPLRFIGFCTLLCHAHSLRPPGFRRYPVKIQTAPLPAGPGAQTKRQARACRLIPCTSPGFGPATCGSLPF